MDRQNQFAGEAVRKLREAVVSNANVYIYGAAGFGKTSAVERVLDRDSAAWISLNDTEGHALQALRACDASRYVVLDDVQCVESTLLQRQIVQMAGKEGYRMVMIGRATLPSWLSALRLQSGVLVIPEEELRATEGELTAYCASAGLKLSCERIRTWLALTGGNAMVLEYLVRQLQQGAQDGPALEASIRRTFMSYLDEEVVGQWSRDVQTFLMQVSVVDAFTLEMAESITGDDGSALLLSRAERVGNLFSSTGEEWRIRPVLLETMRERAMREFGRRRVNRLLYNAGRYLESGGQTMQALAVYEQCGERDSILSILVREARKHAGVGQYWALREYYQALSEEEVEREPVLMTALSLLHSVLMNTEKSEYWYARLKDYAANARGGDRSEANAQIAYLDIALPHRGSGELVRILKAASTLLRSSGDILRPVSLTNNQPSLMNGGKDFCEWSKTDELLARTLGPVVERMLGKAGIGLVQTALGESAYEKGEDRFRVLSRLTKAQNQSENNGILEMLWVDIGLQAKLALGAGDMEYAQKLVAGMLQRAEREGASRLCDSVRAFSCWLSLYENKTSRILSWMETAPDETVEFCTLNRYLYLVRIYGYIALGRHTEALVLIRRMTLYADYAQRTYLQMEYGLLNAIILRRTGKPWKDEFVQTLKRAREYHFVPLVSAKGAAVLSMLTEVKALFTQDDGPTAAWFRQVLDEAAHMARLYPNYLKGTGIDVSAFSPTALQVLRMQAACYTTKEIADRLHITQRTVKYHASENYRKLDAKNLIDAVQIAQSLHLL